MIDSSSLRIRFDKIDRFIKIYDGARYLTSFGSEKYDALYYKIRYLVSLKSGITYYFSHNFAEIKIDLAMHNVIIHIKSVLPKDKNQYY